jgi:hypothetical protein
MMAATGSQPSSATAQRDSATHTQEAWEDAHLPPLLSAILARHNWSGKVGGHYGLAAPAPAAAGPWFGRFRYTVC